MEVLQARCPRPGWRRRRRRAVVAAAVALTACAWGTIEISSARASFEKSRSILGDEEESEGRRCNALGQAVRRSYDLIEEVMRLEKSHAESRLGRQATAYLDQIEKLLEER